MAKPGDFTRRFKFIQRNVFHDEYGREQHILDAIDEDGIAWCLRSPGGDSWTKITSLPDKYEVE